MPWPAWHRRRSRLRRARPGTVVACSGGPSDQLVTGGPLQQEPEALRECDGRLPAEQASGAVDVGLPLHGVVLRQLLEDDRPLGAGRLDHLRGELEERELPGVAEVDGIVIRRESEQPAIGDKGVYGHTTRV